MVIVKKIIINDVVLVVGVFVSIVLLVLSGKGCIFSVIGEWVNQVIEQLGFVCNCQVVLLCGGQSGVIGFIVSDLLKLFYVELIVGFIDVLERQGKMVFFIQGGCSGEKMVQWFDMLVVQGVDGVIIVGVIDCGSELCECVVEVGVLLVFVFCVSYFDDVDLICLDNMQVVQLVMEYFICCGYQWIVWFGGQSVLLMCVEWVGGYCVILLKYGLLFYSEWVLECEFSQKQVVEVMIGLLCQNLIIIVVLCYNNVVVIGVWFGLLWVGRQSGEDGVESYFEQWVVLVVFVDVLEVVFDDLFFIWVIILVWEMGKSLVDLMLWWLEEGIGEM